MFIIQIDPISVRKNPNGGYRGPYIYNMGLPIITETKISNDGSSWTKKVFINGALSEHTTITGMAKPEYWAESKTIEYPRTELYTLGGEPKYFFTYLPTPVKCDDCGAEFPYTELLALEFDGEDYEYTNTGCPKCGYWNCCGIEFQKIEDFLLGDSYED